MSKELTKADVLEIIKTLKSRNKADKSTVKTSLQDEILEAETVSRSHSDYLKKSFTEIARCQAQLDSIEKVSTEVNGKMVKPVNLQFTARHEVDDFIEKELKARRVGDFVCWKLADGLYKYNPLSDTLVRLNHTGLNNEN